MPETIPHPPSATEVARRLRCDMCWAPPGQPCQRRPAGDHLERIVAAVKLGLVSRGRTGRHRRRPGRHRRSRRHPGACGMTAPAPHLAAHRARTADRLDGGRAGKRADHALELALYSRRVLAGRCGGSCGGLTVTSGGSRIRCTGGLSRLSTRRCRRGCPGARHERRTEAPAAPRPRPSRRLPARGRASWSAPARRRRTSTPGLCGCRRAALGADRLAAESRTRPRDSSRRSGSSSMRLTGSTTTGSTRLSRSTTSCEATSDRDAEGRARRDQLLVAAASLAQFAESYRALLDWASHHGLHGGWAVAWPLQVDTFIAVGELALFVALADRWPVRSPGWPRGVVTALGLAVSVAGNVGHVAGARLAPAGPLQRCRRWRPRPRSRSASASSSASCATDRLADAPAQPKHAVRTRVRPLAALNGHAERTARRRRAVRRRARRRQRAVASGADPVRAARRPGPKASEIQAYLRSARSVTP